MHRYIDQWYSPALRKNMEIAEYGHYGFAMLMLPTAAADFLEYERFLLIDAIKPWIDSGIVKVYSINSINAESWLNNSISGIQKASRHQEFNNYVYHEVIPYIRNRTSPETPIITCGASFGALHAANLFFKRPNYIHGCIAMSGLYDLGKYSKGHWDENTYFNSPVHYLQDINDQWHLDEIRKSQYIHILSGSGSYEAPEGSRQLSDVLASKQIAHDLDIWGYDIAHDWPTWRTMLPYLLEYKF